MKRLLFLAASLLAAVPFSMLRAQTAGELVAQGIAAYHALEYDAAAALLRRGLTVTGNDALPDSALPGGWVFLGATEFFRGARDSAAAAFRHALQADPRHRPDPLIFPPPVANAFDAVRRTTAYVRPVLAADTTIILGTEFFAVRLDASAFQNITVDLVREDGRPLRRLYGGPIADSLLVRWEGLDSTGRAPLQGRLLLQVTSRAPSGRARLIQLPLTTIADARDTLPHPLPPPDSTLLPELEPRGPALRALAAGVLTGFAAVLVPAVVADQGASAPTRFFVAGTLSAAGVLGYLQRRPGRVILPNQVANEVVRDAWRRQLESVRTENVQRLNDRVLRIRSAAPMVVEGGDEL